MELTHRRQTTPLAKALAALRIAEGAKGSRSARRRQKALAALAEARLELDRLSNTPTMAEITATNWSTARADVLSTKLANAVASLSQETP